MSAEVLRRAAHEDAIETLRNAAEEMRETSDPRWRAVSEWLTSVAAAWPWEGGVHDLDGDPMPFEDSLDSAALACAEAYLTAREAGAEGETREGGER